MIKTTEDQNKNTWISDIEEALAKVADLDILPQFKPRRDATYRITLLEDSPRLVKPKIAKFSKEMFVIKVLHDNMEKTFNVTSKSARLALAKIMQQNELTSLRDLTILVQKTEGTTKYGKVDLYQMQLAK